jgi:hypothetical protein
VDLIVLDIRFRNRREKIYRNMLYFCKICDTSYLNLETIFVMLQKIFKHKKYFH